MIPVSPEFNDAQESDSVAYRKQVKLISVNYANSAFGTTATASNSDVSGNYPATGANNGDRTEINIGAAAAADNGVGKASWKGRYAPDGSGDTWLWLQFNTTRKFNRVKLYNRAADPLLSYILQYWDAGTSAWVTFAGTPDRFTPPAGSGYGQGGFGEGGFGGGTGWPGAGYTGGLDVYDTAALITTDQIICAIYSTTSGGVAQIVELQAFNCVNISDRVESFGIDRRKDMKQQQPIATQLGATLDNTDRFFSISYSPTLAELAAGYMNSEIADLGIDIEVSEGYDTAIGPELIRTFTGSVDSITPQVSSANVSLMARDYTKHLIDVSDSSALKTSIDITDAIRYVLNRQNISDYEMSLYTSGITLDFFFTYNTSVLTSIQQLTQAAGDAMFFFDENGKANFEFYMNSIYNSFTGSGQAYWLTGAMVNTDAYSNVGWIQKLWFLIDDFANGNYIVNPTWTVGAISTGAFSAAAGYLEKTWATTGTSSFLYLPFTKAYGLWRFKLWRTDSWLMGHVEYSFISDGSIIGNGYKFRIRRTYTGGESHTLIRVDGGSETNLWNADGVAADANYVHTITRDAAGVFTIYRNGASVGTTAADNNYTTSSHLLLISSPSGARDTSGSHCWDSLWYSPSIDATAVASSETIAQGVWISPTIDQGASVTAEGFFTYFDSTPAGTSVLYSTRTSDDGITWDAWVAVPIVAPLTTQNGNLIASAVKRYLQVKVAFTCPQDDGLHNADTTTPSVAQFIVSWYFGTGQNKWQSTINFYFSYDQDIIDLQEQVSDNLGGDTAVKNYIEVSTAPLILSGADTDTVWQGTTGAPAAAISVTNPLTAAAGTLVYNLDISGGMDIANMSGVDPSCVAITWGTAAGTTEIVFAHPTKPVLHIVVTSPGTITDLRLIGKTYRNTSTPYLATATDATSIARHKKRSDSLQNNYIINENIAQVVADKLILNQKEAPRWIPDMPIIAKLNLQPGDQIYVTEVNSGITATYYAIGYNRQVQSSGGTADLSMNTALMKIPV